MSENEKQPDINIESTTPVESDVADLVSVAKKKSPIVGYVVAVIIVVTIILGVVYLLEKEGRSSTGIFDSIIASREATKVVATVNGEDITNARLTTSVQQFTQAAVAQGVDTSTPEAQKEIRDQALEVLINTHLLKQAAVEQGVVVTDEQVSERLQTIQDDIGGEDVLQERMLALNLNMDQLQQDIRDEMLIQELLDSVFQSSVIDVTEEEIIALYENAGGEAAGLPPLEEVRGEVEAQIVSSKEQLRIEEYLNGLKAEAEISIQ